MPTSRITTRTDQPGLNTKDKKNNNNKENPSTTKKIPMNTSKRNHHIPHTFLGFHVKITRTLSKINTESDYILGILGVLPAY